MTDTPHKETSPEARLAADLPLRVIVDQHGHYWRDYGEFLSMCPVSTENVELKTVASFYRLVPPPDEAADLNDAPRLRAALKTALEYIHEWGELDSAEDEKFHDAYALLRESE